jgi:hypothetical protein
MRHYIWLVVILLLAGAGIGGYLYWQKRGVDQPRQASIQALQRLGMALDGGPQSDLLNVVFLPPSMGGRTPEEHADFLRKALKDEVSPEGIAILGRTGRYGALTEVFPDEAQRWSELFGVKAADCVAFRAEKNGLRAEVVICTNGPMPKIMRVNNVRQLAL